MKKQHIAGSMLMASIAVGLMSGVAVADVINVTNWTEALAATPVAGDTVSFAAGNYSVTEPLSVVDGVTYRGAGAGSTILDGGGTSRAFTAWGDRGAVDGVVDGVNDTGQKNWIIERMTIQNCAGDTLNRQDILSVARNLLDNYTGTPYTNDPAAGAGSAQAQAGALVDNPTWFTALDADTSNTITDTECQAYLDANPPGSAGHLVANDDADDDGGALNVDNGASGTLRDCSFLNNQALGDDGGAVAVTGQLSVLTVDNCLFDGNKAADQAGAIRQEGGSTTNQQGSTVTITDSTFLNNEATGNNGGAILAGGSYNTLTTVDCLFQNNTSVTGNAGAVLVNATNITYIAENCVFDGNTAGNNGGAILANGEANTFSAKNCLFRNNSSTNNSGVFNGTHNLTMKHEFINCVFANNTAGNNDLVQMRGGYPVSASRAVNCTFVGNTVTANTVLTNRDGAADRNGDSNSDAADSTVLAIANNIFVNNAVGNNVLRGNRTGGGGNPPNTTFGFLRLNNNIFFGNTVSGGGAAGNWAGGTDHLENGVDVGTITTDPNLDAEWIPLAGSSAIDAGDAGLAPTDDYRGWDRVGAADIGALEFGAEAPPPPPEPVTVITANVYPPFVAEGMLIVLTAPEGSGYQWRKTDVDIPGATNRTLVFDPVTEEDAGTYTVEYDDGTKIVTVSDPFILSVLPAGSVPAAGIVGLVALAGACGLGGARLVRRRN